MSGETSEKEFFGNGVPGENPEGIVRGVRGRINVRISEVISG